MYTYATAYNYLKGALKDIYDEREGAAIAHGIMEYITGATKLQRITDKDKLLTETEQEELERGIPLLAEGVPMQYIIGSAWFMGKEFKVNGHVLIPRPETEELVAWVVQDYNGQQVSVLDIGSGSGCIPVMIDLLLSGAVVTSVDVSVGAIEMAKNNASLLGAKVEFKQLDFLSIADTKNLPVYDIIVSNPPYIPETEKHTLHKNVLEHEPRLALFVPGNDPLLFYRAIAEFGLTHLAGDGAIYCELYVDYANDTRDMFVRAGYNMVELRKDMHGNLRMLKVQK